MRRECWERFPRHRLQMKQLVSDPGMHRGACMAHVPWCMPGSLTHGGGEKVPDIPGACTTRNSTYLARGPCIHCRLWVVCMELPLVQQGQRAIILCHFVLGVLSLIGNPGMTLYSTPGHWKQRSDWFEFEMFAWWKPRQLSLCLVLCLPLTLTMLRVMTLSLGRCSYNFKPRTLKTTEWLVWVWDACLMKAKAIIIIYAVYCVMTLTHCPLGDVVIILKVWIYRWIYKNTFKVFWRIHLRAIQHSDKSMLNRVMAWAVSFVYHDGLAMCLSSISEQKSIVQIVITHAHHGICQGDVLSRGLNALNCEVKSGKWGRVGTFRTYNHQMPHITIGFPREA